MNAASDAGKDSRFQIGEMPPVPHLEGSKPPSLEFQINYATSHDGTTSRTLCTAMRHKDPKHIPWDIKDSYRPKTVIPSRVFQGMLNNKEIAKSSPEKSEVSSPPLTFVYGPTIRDGKLNAQAIRSQLMRQRYREKRDRFRLGLVGINARQTKQEDSRPAVRVCLCERESFASAPRINKVSPHANHPTDQREIYPRQLLPQGDLVTSICPHCYGVLVNPESAVRGSNLRQIAAGELDPFLSVNRDTTPNLDRILHYCIHVLWPMVRPVEFAEGCFTEYLTPRRSPLVLHSMLYSASLHMDAMAIIRGVTGHVFQRTEQLRLKGLVMNEMIRRLSETEQEPVPDGLSDEILMSILYLAANENLDKVAPPEKNPFCSPFRELQTIEFYGSCEYHPLHWQTVQQIVVKRGLHTVKLYGLQWLISISGLLVAMTSDSKPVFPLVYPDGKPYVYRAPLQMLKIPQAPWHSLSPNKGFQQLASLHPPVKGNIIRVFVDIGEMVQALEFLVKQPCGPKMLTTIADTRAQVVHRLCGLPDRTDRPSSILHKRDCSTEERETSITVYLICRKVALLYSVNVVLPLPRTAHLRQKMTSEIHQYMMELSAEKHIEHASEILLWCSVISAMAAEALELRESFTRKAKGLCDSLGIRSRGKLKELLRSFAWLDCDSDSLGQEIWDRMDLDANG